MDSPMDLVFATPQSQSNPSYSLKRKCVNDSGYVTPIFGSKSKYNSSIESPEVSTSSSYTPVKAKNYTPFTHDIKKRLISSEPLRGAEQYASLSPSVGEVDSYTDFFHDSLSLYTEPMETGPSFGSATEDSGIQSSLGLSEVSKSIQLEMDGEPICQVTPTVKSAMQSGKSSPRKYRDLGTTPRRRNKVRSLAGFGHLDIMYQLGEKSDYSLVVSRILGYLSDKDISAMTMVSKTWRNVCLRDEKASNRWHDYIADRKERKENLNMVRIFYNLKYKTVCLSYVFVPCDIIS